MLFFLGRTLLMLRSINRAYRLDSNNPELHTCLVRFLQHTNGSSLGSTVAEVVKRQTSGIFSSSNAAQLNVEYLKKNSKSLPHLFQGARMMYFLDSNSQSKALSLITDFENFEGVTLENCIRLLESLCIGDFGSCESTVEKFRAKCHSRFPYAIAFRLPGFQESKLTANHQEKEIYVKN